MIMAWMSQQNHDPNLNEALMKEAKEEWRMKYNSVSNGP